MIAHDGGIEGFNTALAYYPDDKLVVAVLANLNGPAGQIAGNLAKVALGEKVVLPTERKEITVSPEILKQYVGTYELTPTFSIAMTLENGQLMSQATNQQKLPLFAESETMFFLKARGRAGRVREERKRRSDPYGAAPERAGREGREEVSRNSIGIVHMRLSSKVAIITGGGSGIGKAIARRLCAKAQKL